jgi:hypothetical protein
MTMVPPVVTNWITDSGASNHTSVRLPRPTDPLSIVVGNGSSLPVTSLGNTALLGPFYLNNIIVISDLIYNLFICLSFHY